MDFCPDVLQRFDEGTLKVRRDGQLLPTKRGTEVQSSCISLDLIEHFHVRGKALVFEKGVDDGERRPVLAKDVEREQLEVCDWNASERSVDADSFCVAQQPDAPLPCEDNDTSVVADEDTIVCEGWCHNNVLGVDRMLPKHPDPSCKSEVCASPPARPRLVADS